MRFPKPSKRGPKPRRAIARKKKPPRVNPGRGQLRVLADDLMSLFVRHKAGWVCWRCQSRAWDEMQMAHLFGKGAYPAGRYLEANVRCLCCRCHRYFTDRAEEWRELLIEKLGEAEYQKLWKLVRVRQGRVDYRLEALYWDHQLCERDDIWKVQERHEALRARARDLGLEFVVEPRREP